MNKNTLIIKAASAVTNGSAHVKLCKYKKNEGFVPVYGWLFTDLSTDSENKIKINLDRDGVLDTIKGLQDTLPFGCTISVEFPLGTKPVYISDMYHTDMVEALNIIRRHNLDVSSNDITDLRIEGSKVSSSFKGTHAGEFELYEILNARNLDEAKILNRYAMDIQAGSTRMDIELGHTVNSDTSVIGRWRSNGEILFSQYITARQAHTLKSAIIERHEIRDGKLILYIYDRDTLGAFYENGLVLRIRQASSNTNFIVSGVSTNLPNRTLISIDNTDTDIIVAISGVVDISVELIGSHITSNIYKFNTESAIPTPPTPGSPGSTPSGKYLKLNPDKVAFDEDARMLYLAFDSSHDAEIEMLQIDANESTIKLDTTSFALTNRQINVKPSFGFWVQTPDNVNKVWNGKISYKYRIKGMVAKTDSVTLSPENPEIIDAKAEWYNYLNSHIMNMDIMMSYNIQRGENQHIVLKDIVAYSNDTELARADGKHALNISNIAAFMISNRAKNANKVTYKYSFAGKPWSNTKTITKIKPRG